MSPLLRFLDTLRDLTVQDICAAGAVCVCASFIIVFTGIVP